ncbi:MAG TPA: NAD(P)/FAD-dependent oxidoreductase [Terriglobia bacterium]|nr:NAD(P)/FAD-dependent oxidoreductase [Terriglobia bacterium]
MNDYDFDVGIIGAGPGGSSTAAYLAKAGLSCAVFERELFPRPHVGESLVPSSTRILREIGFIDQMDKAGFVPKFGAVWTATSNSPVYDHDWEGLEPDCHADIRFEEREQPGVNLNHTWHVDRGKFDQLLLEHAAKLGAKVHQGVRVKGVDFSDSTRPKILYSADGKDLSTTVRVVVDASGRHTVLGNQLKFKVPDQVFNQFALHTWFEGYNRQAASAKHGFDDYIFIHFLPISNSWIWQIPISATVTSIGVVTQKRNFEKTAESREKFFWDCISTRPELYDGLKAANQMRPLKEEGDYSYGMKQICGDGFVLVGDAARFVDPIFSSGVSIALTSAKLASEDIIKAASNGGQFTKDNFQTFETTMRRGTKNWYEFISLYYRLNVLFTAFIQDPRYRLDVLKLLQGDLYDTDTPEVLDVMRRMVSEVEQRQNHPWHKLLGDLTGEAMKPLF